MRFPQTSFLPWCLGLVLSTFVLSCSDKDDPTPQTEENNLVEASNTGTWAAAELKLLIQLSGRDINTDLFAYDVDVYRVVYTTTYQDAELNASGLVLLPKQTGNALPMISFQHGTIVRNADAPSLQDRQSEQVISYAALASMGFITVVPDYIGFGESSEIFHPYYVEEPTATAVVDMLYAGRALADDQNVDFDNRLFLAGYSQGGYATLAAQKALEASTQDDFEIIASFPGAGGYDITSMQNYLLNLDTYPDPYYLAYVAMSYRSFYGEDDLLTALFNEPYATTIPTLFDGTKSAPEIDAALTEDVDVLVREDIIIGTNTDPLYEYLSVKFEENSLTDWAPGAPVFMYHGDADVTVPIENSVVTYEKLIDQGANAEELQLITLQGRDHTTAIEPYIEDIVTKLQQLK